MGSEMCIRDRGIPHISTGEFLRQAISRGDELGNRVREYVTTGELVPDDIMERVVRERVKQGDAKNGFILDGYPRTLNQAKSLDTILEEDGKRVDFIINMVLDEEEIVRRLSSRRQCPECGAIYNMLSNPPRENKYCKRCGAEVIRRPDDAPETIRKRLAIYEKNAQPVVDYYKHRPGYIEMNTSLSMEEGTEYLLRRIRNGN